MQWGKLQNNLSTFPIAFCSFVATGNTVIRTGGSELWRGSSGDVSLTKIIVSTPDYTNIGTYVAVGIQQWGTADGTRGNFTTNLNVPYLNFYLPYASSTNTYGTDIWTVSARVETDLSKIGLSSEGNFEIIWLAIGM